MNRNRRMPLSDVTKDYLCSYQDILYTMIGEMTNAPLTDSISHNFIVQMIPHHEAAIDMARSLLRCTTCIPLQTIAKTDRRRADQKYRRHESGALCLRGGVERRRSRMPSPNSNGTHF
ncbi:MAG: hypothetical protein ACI39E_00035 [Acutalibacteraceae bacterium]